MRKNFVRRLVVWGLVLSGAGGAFACSSHDDAKDLQSQLKEDTGVAWGMYVDPRNASPRVLTPATPVHVGGATPEADARAFFNRYSKELGSAGHDLRVIVDEQELGGGHYVRFQHYLSGTNLRLFDVVSMAHFTADGSIYVAQPGFRTGLDAVEPNAKLSANEAASAAINAAIANCGADPSVQPIDPPELGVLADEAMPFALVYRVKFGFFTARCLAPQFDVDAQAGTVLRAQPGAAAVTDSAPGTRAYVMKDASDMKPLDITLDNGQYRLETSASPTKVITKQWTVSPWLNHPVGSVYQKATPGDWDAAHYPAPGAAVDAHFGITTVLRYYRENHGRKGTDGSDGEIDVFVHDNIDDDNGDNAKLSSVSVPFLLFFSHDIDAVLVGDGDYWWPTPRFNWLPLSAAFDVMAHEVTHGVTAHTSQLVYMGESGALNETFSDVMGCSADQWVTPDRYKDPSHVLIGDRVAITPENYLRNMIIPEQAKVPQPSTMDSVTPCDPAHPSYDLCGVHGNSGIGNRAWSLMTLGGTHAITNISVDSPLGFPASRVLWYETFTRLRPQATITEAALAQVTWTAKYDAAHLTTVACAWAAVKAVNVDSTLGALIPALAGIVCSKTPEGGAPPAPEAGTSASPPSSGPCAGRSDGWVCDPSVPYSAFSCDAAKKGANVTCSDLAQKCKPASVSDPSANVDDTGVLDCE